MLISTVIKDSIFEIVRNNLTPYEVIISYSPILVAQMLPMLEINFGNSYQQAIRKLQQFSIEELIEARSFKAPEFIDKLELQVNSGKRQYYISKQIVSKLFPIDAGYTLWEKDSQIYQFSWLNLGLNNCPKGLVCALSNYIFKGDFDLHYQFDLALECY